MEPMSLDEAYRRWLDQLEGILGSAGADGSLLGEMAAYSFLTGGKRIRGILPSWLAANLGGNGDAALPLGAGLEILHNASLVHDDLQDGDTHRRGKLAVWSRWGAAQAINLGDGLFCLGLGQIARARCGAEAFRPVCEALYAGTRGQVMEFQLQLPADQPESIAPSLAAVEAVARAKTGALFGACLLSGALAAGLSLAEAQRWYTFGEELGLLYQVQDDYLDLVGDKGRDRRGSDIVEGKISFPVAWALERAPGEAADEVLRIVRLPRSHTGPRESDRAIALLRDLGALGATASWLRERRERAGGHPFSAAVPGLVDHFLAPVSHVL